MRLYCFVYIGTLAMYTVDRSARQKGASTNYTDNLMGKRGWGGGRQKVKNNYFVLNFKSFFAFKNQLNFRKRGD